MASALMPTYDPLPISLEKGEGVWVWDTQGNRYLDAFAGIAVTSLGHSYPAVVQAIQEQASQIIHTSNMLQIDLQETLAQQLVELSGLEQVFFANSGAEANECAIKLARLYGHKQKIKNPAIIVAENAFHGRTLATITASGSRAVQAGFEPLVQGFIRVPYNNIEAITSVANNTNNVVAVMLEPIQGQTGVNIPDPDYLSRVNQLTQDNHWLLILDEVQTGMGRTGQWFAHQHAAIKPDVMTLAKALANGVPIGACLAGTKAKDILTQGTHGATFGGNPLSCRAALAVLAAFEKENLVEHCAKVGNYLLTHLQERLSQITGVVEVRGQGLLIGIELDRPCRAILNDGLKAGIIFTAAGNVIRLCPPLILTIEQADQIVSILGQIIPEFINNSPLP